MSLFSFLKLLGGGHWIGQGILSSSGDRGYGIGWKGLEIV